MIILPKTVKWIITDFDGIVTDNCIYINDNGDISRKINFKDMMGFYALYKNGYDVAIISGEENSAIKIFSEKFQLKEVHQKIRDKLSVLKDIILKYNLSQEEYVYLGDDVNDLECLSFAKYKVTVPHAVEKVKNTEGIQITKCAGGDGAFREVADCLIG